jgi:hypothetical protein
VDVPEKEVAVEGDLQPGDPQDPGSYHAGPPQEPEPAGLSGAWPADERGTGTEPDPAAEYPETSWTYAQDLPGGSGEPPARRGGQPWRRLAAAGIIVFVLAIVLTFVLIKVTAKPAVPSAAPASNSHAGVVSAAIIGKVTSVPASALVAIGDGGAAVTAKPHLVNGTALTLDGKPEVFYLGSEYCPYCAAERWAMIGALGRFGTFSGLTTIRSAAADGAGDAEPYPNTATWTFAKSSYSSPYLTFTPVENLSNIPDPSNGGYTTLETPTRAQQALISKYDGPPYVPSDFADGIPFIDFGNKYAIFGASYSPGVLAGLSWSQIAADLSNPDSPVAQAIDGTANYITAAICGTTGNQPASACTATVRSLETQLKS